MGFERGFVSVFLTVILTLVLALLTGVFLAAGLYRGAVLSGVLMLVLMYRVYKVRNRQDREILLLLEAYANDDTSAAIPEAPKGEAARKIYSALEILLKRYKTLREESENRENYYKALLQQSATGLVVIDSQGKLIFVNEAAGNLAEVGLGDTSGLKLLNPNHELHPALMNAEPGKETVIRRNTSAGIQQLLIQASLIRVRGLMYKIVSLNDIRHELDKTELDSYQKLIRVLIHEMMNNMAPLLSVSQTLSHLINPGGQPLQAGQITPEWMETTRQGLKTISGQAENMIRFVKEYRKLMQIPVPKPGRIDTLEWASRLRIMYHAETETKGIELSIFTAKNATHCEGDEALLGQALNSLIRNAVEALETHSGKREIIIRFQLHPGGLYRIDVLNNGPAIPEEMHEKIFVPFFTTREEVSGIGLSLARQILRSHNGRLELQNRNDGLTCFSMIF